MSYAQETQPPVLISETTSTRAIALESVTQQHEPFTPNAAVSFGADNRTRILLFAMNLSLAAGESFSAVQADAEDGEHRLYPLTVEYLGPVPDQPWATSITLRLNDDLGDVGDVLVRITYRGVSSNRVRVGIGHVGDGPPDDQDAVPTPGSAFPQSTSAAPFLTGADVSTIFAQAVSEAVRLNKKVTVIVTDHEATSAGVFFMNGAPGSTIRSVGPAGSGLENTVIFGFQAADAKAATAALLSSGGNAFSSRTAGFIIQEHFPPGVNLRAGGPLYGVQFSSLICGGIIGKPSLRLGLSGDPGGLPIYKNGVVVGGVGIEGDELYTVDRDPADFDQPFEEVIATAAVRGYEPPASIRADNILIDGIRLPYTNTTAGPPAPLIPSGNLPGVGFNLFLGSLPPPSPFVPAMVGGISGEVEPRFFPFVGSSSPAGGNALTSSDVQTIITRAAQQANITRAAIRQPLGSNARVTIAVVDVEGKVLGLFRTLDAPGFGFDVSVQKARTAAFFSRSDAGGLLRAAGLGAYVDRAAADGLLLHGSIAFSSRAIGFLHRPFFPDGIDNTSGGPFSTEFTEWSPFNVGLQLDLVKDRLSGGPNCTGIPSLPNGIQIFPGGIPLYKNGVLVGAIGISGDGVDQDDLIAAAGANGYSPPAAMRSDQFFVRKVRLPFVKFPRSPNL